MLNIYNSQNHNNSTLDKKSAEEKKKAKPVDVGRYVDPSNDFGAKEFKWSIWYVTNKVLLYKITVWSLVVLSAGFWLFSLFAWGKYLIFGIAEDQRLARELSSSFNYIQFNNSFAPKPLEIMGTNIYTGGVKKYDIVTEVVNPNQRFQVSFDYYYKIGEESTVRQVGILLPNQNSLLTYLGVDGDSYPSGAELNIENVKWKTIDNHIIPDATVWQENRLRFSINNFQFLPAGLTDGAGSSVIRFDLVNDSAFGYLEAKFHVALFQGSSMVGVIPLSLDRFKAGEIRSVDLRSFVAGLDVSEVKIYPLIDIYNRSSYLLPEA